VDFENTGNAIVAAVKVRMKMPKVVKLETVKMLAYRFGKSCGEGTQVNSFVLHEQSNGELQFEFKTGFLTPKDPNTVNDNLFAKGFVEFSVEIPDNPEISIMNLLPEEAMVEFNGIAQTVELLKDFSKQISDNDRASSRKISSKCDCMPLWNRGEDRP
jgi:hypothetical protein